MIRSSPLVVTKAGIECGGLSVISIKMENVDLFIVGGQDVEKGQSFHRCYRHLHREFQMPLCETREQKSGL